MVLAGAEVVVLAGAELVVLAGAEAVVLAGAELMVLAGAEVVVLAGAELVVLAGAGSERPVTTAAAAATTSADDVMQQSARDRKRNRVANVKTAAMLFVVTVVFVVTFLPAFLMTVHLLPYNVVIFYMYFANNVANPVIYSFMNHNFRAHLRHLICRRRAAAQVIR